MPCIPVWFTFDFAVIAFQSCACGSSYQEAATALQTCSWRPSLSPSTLHITSSLTLRPCVLSQVQGSWAREPFEFALCIRLPTVKCSQAHSRAILLWCSLPESLPRPVLAFTFTDCQSEQTPGVEHTSEQFIGGEWEGRESLMGIGCL